MTTLPGKRIGAWQCALPTPGRASRSGPAAHLRSLLSRRQGAQPQQRHAAAKATVRAAARLGLAIARQLVEHNDGHIRVESVPGQGTTFCAFCFRRWHNRPMAETLRILSPRRWIWKPNARHRARIAELPSLPSRSGARHPLPRTKRSSNASPMRPRLFPPGQRHHGAGRPGVGRQLATGAQHPAVAEKPRRSTPAARSSSASPLPVDRLSLGDRSWRVSSLARRGAPAQAPANRYGLLVANWSD